MTKFLIGGALAAIAAASVAAAAQPAPPPPPGVAPGTGVAVVRPLPPHGPGAPEMRMRIMSDRVMTRAEVADHVAKLFAKLDANHDGAVTKEEVEALHARMMAAMDKVGDVEKRLADRGVFIGDRGAMFDRLDSNHDGNISRQEFLAHKPEVRQERVMIMRDGPSDGTGMHDGPGMHEMGEMHGMPGMHDGMRMKMHGAAFGGHMFEMADANHDGRVTLPEAQAAALAHFDKADVNHDGKITPDERREMHETVRIERRPS